MKMEINGVQAELSVEEFVKLSELLEDKTEDTREVTGYEIARKLIDELIEEDGDTDKEPERFSVGDVVLVNDSIDDIGVITRYNEGDSLPYKVEYFRTGVGEWCFSSEIHKLEGEELAEYNRDHIEEGDIVVITGNTNLSANNVGDIGKVGEEIQTGFSRKVFVPNGQTSGIWTYLEEFRLATEDERKQYEEATEEHPFKVGDKVRVIVSSTERPYAGWGGVKSGDVGVIKEVNHDKIYASFEDQSKWSAQPSELELFDEEADLPAGTTVKLKSSGKVYTIESRLPSQDDYGYGKAYSLTNANWLGVDQFEVLNVPLSEPTPVDTEDTIEVGDIVRVVRNAYAGHVIGTIGIVGDIDKVGDFLVEADDEEYWHDDVELIAKHDDRHDL